MRIYEKVRAYITDNGLKQIAVAQKSGIPKTTFNAILNGKRTMYADDLRAICLALNVSPELFVNADDQSCPNSSDCNSIIKTKEEQSNGNLG